MQEGRLVRTSQKEDCIQKEQKKELSKRLLCGKDYANCGFLGMGCCKVCELDESCCIDGDSVGIGSYWWECCACPEGESQCHNGQECCTTTLIQAELSAALPTLV